MEIEGVWKRRQNNAMDQLLHFLWVIVIYLVSELVIWGISCVLASLKLQFFASIFGMALVFLLMGGLQAFSKATEAVYHRWIKSKVDFLNAHLGIGFPIPIIMLDRSELLEGGDIARIIGSFVSTNLFSWTVVFFLSFGSLCVTGRLQSSTTYTEYVTNFADSRPCSLYPANTSWLHVTGGVLNCVDNGHRKSSGPSSSRTQSEVNSTPTSSRPHSVERPPILRQRSSPVWNFIKNNFAVLASFLAIFIVGAPVAAASYDQRILDGCILWFIWITSVSLQRSFKVSLQFSACPRLKIALATLMNPVLMTTLATTGYVRVKAAAIEGGKLIKVLEVFSGGTPLYALWTSLVSGEPVPDNPSGWFGAGDAALSILECGILMWGFKLYECRRQLFSLAGLITVVVCVASAAANVFLSVLAGRAMGLGTPEALAFAARSTTLALAKPAMEAVGGNVVVNATLVVSNGILGQLMYPFVLDKLGVKIEKPSVSSEGDPTCLYSRQSPHQYTSRKKTTEVPVNGDEDYKDDAVTVAAGIAIGVNGAAMGVAYLYETKSRAAPYAALAMTVFGVMTVVFTTVEPFRDVLVGLASR